MGENVTDVLRILQSVRVTRIFEDASPNGAHQVGVGIDQPREDGLASAVDEFGIGVLGKEVGGGAKGGDASFVYSKGGIVEDVPVGIAGDDSGVGKED